MDNAETTRADDAEDRLRRCLALFASVIKSGEPWTDTCEREFRAAMARARPGE